MRSRPTEALVGMLVVCACLLASSSARASFGVSSFRFSTNEAPPAGSGADTLGPPDIQAGSHPWSLTTGFELNTTTNTLTGRAIPDGDVKDVEVNLPPGFTGDPTATPKCTAKQFVTPPHFVFPESSYVVSGASCPPSTQVGVAEVEFLDGGLTLKLHLGVYNLVAPPGVPAEFGFNGLGIPIVLAPSVRTGGDYGLTVDVKNASQLLGIKGSTVTLWGVPADPVHDGLRGECLGQLGESLGSCPGDAALRPFLSLPTSCTPGPLTATVSADSWQEPGVFASLGTETRDGAGTPLGVAGCDRLDFRPTITVQPDTSAADSPSGLRVHVHIPQNDDPAGLAEANLKKVVVTLPRGMAVSPSAANGLEACTPTEIGIENANAPTCPQAAKVGTAEIETPILESPLTGSVYLAQQEANPFGSLLALYLVAEGDGVLVKVAGHVEADPLTGQLTTTFDNNPQQPFSDLRVRLFGGPRAPLVTPARCGSYEETSALTPYGTELPVSFAEQLAFSSACGGAFSPSLTAGTTNNQAGAYSPFTVTISRGDQDQDLGAISVQTPPGVLGMLSKVALCGEPQARLGTCSAASRIGTTTVGAGPGPDPVFLPEAGHPANAVYLTGRYEGGPFGLSIVVPAEAGPFNLGSAVVRAAIEVDAHTGALTVRSDSLPQILRGIPLQLRTINVSIDRGEFTFNPTNCEALTVSATVSSTEGARADVSSPFHAANCALLPFKPSFKASTQGKASKAGGASLDVKVGYPKGAQANIQRVVVSLPVQLPARLTTLQKACTAATFAANPASCPAASNVGTARAVTPVLNVPLVGPAYLVSHGGAAFPDLVVVLEGQGVRLDLVGNTNIKKGITTSTFATVPDAPVSSFELKLPEGPHSVLATNLPGKARYSFCGKKLVMPTIITGQNGAQVKQNTKIAITGCRKPKKHGRA